MKEEKYPVSLKLLQATLSITCKIGNDLQQWENN